MLKVEHPLYHIWKGMKERCFSPLHKNYKDYGRRGITVCKEWLDFDNFVNDMGERPTIKHTIDRVDNNKDYCKSNCKWSTQSEQSINCRIRKDNTSGTKGVYAKKNSQGTILGYSVKYKGKYLGYRTSLEDAIALRKSKEV